MRVKFLATWGLLFSSAVGSPMPQPEPKPEPKPVPMPVPGNTGSSEDWNTAHKIATAGLITGTALTIATAVWNDCMARYSSRAQTNKDAVQSLATAFQNYIQALVNTRDPGAGEQAKSLNSRLYDIQNRYGRMRINAGRRAIADLYKQEGLELYDLVKDAKAVLAESEKYEKISGSGSSTDWNDRSKYYSFIKRAVTHAQQNGIASGSDFKKREAGRKSSSILGLRNIIPRAQMLHFFDI
ncbi:hypothetical protein PpBr36_02005 [Pyricularia pennisetigena]|uniref:hypothetical protein n=1 Tax=Pyricularia pennisetigena TaxID=1578925 RepID=UPI001152F41C|nr:hypothetical protein PpBr36_02005 [Pyricularia pennisetigena]TLS27950.1 hypothetical protein PpBr36_02005 [Pyricularia pennisetigena]